MCTENVLSTRKQPIDLGPQVYVHACTTVLLDALLRYPTECLSLPSLGFEPARGLISVGGCLALVLAVRERERNYYKTVVIVVFQ